MSDADTSREARDKQTAKVIALRERAEAKIGTALRVLPPSEAKSEDLQRLIHELSVHQAELEMQNDELLKAQQALELSRARYFDLFDQAPVGYLTCTLNGLILEANRTATTMLGWTQTELRSRRIGDLAVAEDRPRFTEQYAKLLTRSKPQSCELRLTCSDKSLMWVQLHMTFVGREPENAPVCRIAITDVGERIALQQRMLRLASIVDSSEDAIIGRDLDGIVTSWNTGAERLLGFTAAEMFGRTIGALMPLEGKEAPKLHRLLRQQQAVPHFETELKAKDDRIVPVSVSVSPIRDAAGRTFGTAMIARDISERIRAEQALRRRLRQLDLLSRSGQALIMSEGASPEILDDVFRRVATATGAEIYVHYRPAAAADTLELVSSLGLADPLRTRMQRIGFGEMLCGIVAQKREPLIRESLQRSRPPGSEEWVAAGIRCYAGYPLLAGGDLLGVVSFATTSRDRFLEGDLQVIQTMCDQVSTTLQRTRLFAEIQADEQALKEADRKKDHFIATLAHELRNPLAPINNAVTILRRIGNPTLAESNILETMARQITYMVRLVDDLLEVSRITLGKIALRVERVELMTVVKAAIDISKPQIETGSHRLVVDAPDEPLFVDADSVRLAQVFANLLNNSAKYTEKGGEIRFTVRREDDEVVVAVRDTGSGISAELLPHIFELFTQGSSSRYSPSGLGIGLTLVHALVDMHGGSVEARSAGAGHGSEFVVRLPLAVDPTGAQPATYDLPIQLNARCRVLLVDDNQDAANSLGGLLELMGAKVEIVYDPFAVLKALDRFEPTAIILDIGMPGMDGYEVARSIRDRPKYRDVMLIALTGWGASEDRRRSRRAGFDHHLVKPADIDVLMKLLHEVCASNDPPGGPRF